MQTSHNSSTSDSTTRVLDTTPSPSSPPSTTTATGGGLPACASCRHQRKKCTQNCILAPFFPAEKTQDFLAVHRVFGVSNVTKLVKGLSLDDRKKAVDSIIWEANCRVIDPVLGPFGEFQRVCEELKFYKTQVPIMQGSVLYKNKGAQQRLIESWNGENNNIDGNNSVNNGSMLDYIQSNGMFKYFGSLPNMERLKQEDQQEGSVIQQQQQMMNDFNQYK